jgi:hypothetical protein
MITKLFISFIISAIVATTLSAQAVIGIPQSAGAAIDGEIKSTEWQLAAITSLIQSNGDTTWILMQHDGANLYFAFYGNLQKGQVVFPEVLMDINHSRSSSWESDDWWFHVSATDCDYQGAYGNFDSCALQRPNWEAVPNYTTGLPYTDSIEVKIPFSTLNYSFIPMDTIGLALVLSNTVNIFDSWPGSASHLQPGTWSEAVLLPWLSTSEKAVEEWSVYPNPAHESISISFGMLNGPAQLKVYTTNGQLIVQRSLLLNRSDRTSAELLLDRGIYILELESMGHNSTRKVIVY